MKHFKYLIIGAGMTADAAVRGIREMDESGSIGIIGDEADPPYTRPYLSKGLWKGKPIEKIWRKTQDRTVDLILGCRAASISPQTKEVTDSAGEVYRYEKLLLATGGTPRRLPFGGEGILYYRTLADYRRLRELSAQKDHFGVIGGGFIGSEIAAALAMNGKKVSMILPEEGIGGRVFPRDLALYLNGYFREKGVEVLAGSSLRDVQAREGAFLLTSGESASLRVDGVVAGLGILPNAELARAAGLQTGNGIAVDELLRTSQADILAAGDVAEFYQPALGKRVRVEHEDNANTMGRLAGYNMAGAGEKYQHLPFFYSDLFELGYEAVGELDARLETYADWQEPFQKGVIYYLEGGRVRGVLLWNTWDTVPAARELLKAKGPYKPGDLKNRLP